MTLIPHGSERHPRPSPPPRTVAAFDFDGTITRGPSLLAFLREVSGLRATTAAVLIGLPRLTLGVLTIGNVRDTAKEALVGRVLRGRDAREVSKIGDAYAESLLKKKLRSEISRRIAWHRSNGHEVVIVSASPTVYIEPAGKLLGADAVIATVLEVGNDGRFTGRFATPNCRGDEKAARLRSWIGSKPARIWAYGNSAGDAELLEMADIKVHVGRHAMGDLPSATRSSSL